MGAIPWGFSYAQGGETMPKKPLRPCSHPGCPNLCDGQFCEQHRVEERRKYDKYERSSDVNRKYGRAWKRIRDRYAAEHPLCEMCLKEGRLTPVQEVHHKYYWLYRVKFGIPATNLATKGDSITFSTPTIEGTILRRNKADAGGKHPWKAEALEGDVTAATITNWYKEVYEPTYTTTPEKQG